MELRDIIKEELFKVTYEQKILNDILNNGIINEAVDFNAVLQKVKAYATKGLLTATVLSGLLSSPAFSQQQKAQIQAVATTINTPQQQIQITPQLRTEWNNFIDWIGRTYPGGIGDTGADPTPQIVAAYQQANPNSPVTATNVKDFQQALVDYNAKWKTLQPNYHPQGTTLSSPSPVDNRIGSITSKMKFPIVAFNVNGKMVNFGTDIDAALKAYSENRAKEIYIDPNLTPQQRFEKNQQLRAAGKPLPTVADVQRATMGSVASN